MAACRNDNRWAMSFGALFGDSSIKAATVARILAHFLIGDKSFGQGVKLATAVLIERANPFLAYLTHVGTAVAFQDSEKAYELMNQSK
jgi:hypothetical protein